MTAKQFKAEFARMRPEQRAMILRTMKRLLEVKRGS